MLHSLNPAPEGTAPDATTPVAQAIPGHAADPSSGATARHLCVALSLCFCAFIYLFYRTERTVINRLFSRAVSAETHAEWRVLIQGRFHPDALTVYSLPEGLWVMCATLVSAGFVVRIRDWRLDCRFLPPLFAVGLEFAQLLQLTQGQFDGCDIAVVLAFWILGLLLAGRVTEKKELFRPLTLNGWMCILSFAIVYLAHVGG